MQSFVVAQPAAAGSKTGHADEAQLVFGNELQFSLFSSDKHHHPRHDQHYRCANGRPQIGFHPGDPYLAQDSRQAGKHCRAQRIPQPCGALGCSAALLFFNHKEGTDGDQYYAYTPGQADTLAQKDSRHQNSQHRDGFVDRHNFVHITKLERLEIAQPACAGGKAGQHQKQKRLPRDLGDRSLRSHHKHHQPREQQHYNGTNGSSYGRVRFLDAALGKNGCQTCKES